MRECESEECTKYEPCNECAYRLEEDAEANAASWRGEWDDAA